MEETEDGRAPAPAAAKAIRPSAPLVPLNTHPPLTLDSRSALAAQQAEIASRINSDPALSVLLLINPVLAFKEFGVQVSPDVSRHIMHTLQFLPAARERHDALEKSLTEALGEPPRPNNGTWLAHTLFQKLQLQAYDIEGLTPAYADPLDAATLQKLQALRPVQKQRYPRTRLIAKTARIGLAAPAPALRRLDLDARLPPLKPAAQAPAELSLGQLYFYKDSHPLARQLLEYGLVLQQAFSFNTPATFREMRDGTRASAFRAWIKSVRFTGPAK